MKLRGKSGHNANAAKPATTGGAHVSQKCSTGYIFTTNTDSCLTHARTAGEMTQADYNCLNISEKSS